MGLDITFESNIIIYVLLLEGNNYYVGMTTRLEKRLREHQSKKGASWTRQHSVISLVETYDTLTKKHYLGEIYEDYFVIKYAARHGIEKVKGGTFTGTFGNGKKRHGLAIKYQLFMDIFFASESIDSFVSRIKLIYRYS